MTIEDIRKENQSVFEKIDAEFAPNVREGQYAKAYASILRDLEKKERSAHDNANSVIAIIISVIAIVVLLVVGVYYTYGAVHIDDAHYAQKFIIYCSVAYSAAAIVAIVTTSIIAKKYNRWKKISNKIACLKEYMLQDEDMHNEYNRRTAISKSIEKDISELCAIATSPARKSSSSNEQSSSSSVSSDGSTNQSSASDRVNYKDGYRDWGYSENGRLYDQRNNQVGYVDSNRVYDNNHDAVGYFDDNGTFHKY